MTRAGLTRGGHGRGSGGTLPLLSRTLLLHKVADPSKRVSSSRVGSKTECSVQRFEIESIVLALTPGGSLVKGFCFLGCLNLLKSSCVLLRRRACNEGKAVLQRASAMSAGHLRSDFTCGVARLHPPVAHTVRDLDPAS